MLAEVYLGSLYVNDFNRFGRTWQVNVQASETYRAQLKDLERIPAVHPTRKARWCRWSA